MGLLDGLMGHREVSLTPRSAMLLACISMVAADGNIDEDELAIIRRIDGSEDTQDWRKAVEAWKRVSSSGECVGLTVPRLDDEQRRFTLANLIDIAMADGGLDGSEKKLLEKYIEAMDVEDDFVRSVVQVVSAKNDRSPFGR